jgi:N-terminal region of Chorein or VPS13
LPYNKSWRVSLRDLRMKNDLFQKLNLPLEMKLGIIKKLDIEMPLTNLHSQPIVAKIDQIFLIVSL